MALWLEVLAAYVLLIPHNAITDMGDVRYIPRMATLIIAILHRTSIGCSSIDTGLALRT
jgi:hypothetical protein